MTGQSSPMGEEAARSRRNRPALQYVSLGMRKLFSPDSDDLEFGLAPGEGDPR